MPLPWPKRGKLVEPYARLPYVYDYLMRHVNYPRWYAYIRSFTDRHEPLPHEVLEIGCGTGIMLERFRNDGWSVYGLDRSRHMVDAARDRLGPLDAGCALWVGDMRQFSLRRQVGLVICLYDSINYCLQEADLMSTFQCVSGAMAPGGLFIFDVVTQRNCRKNFSNYYERDYFNNVDYIRQSHYRRSRGLQINEFFLVFHGAAGTEHYYEKHVQRIYQLRKLEQVLRRQSHWELLGIFNNFSRQKGTEKSDRVHFVVRKV